MVGVCFGKDVYPYFSDMEKQLQFEREKVTIEKSEGVEQLISGGGSTFNWLSIIDEKQPMYLNQAINTSYVYYSNFYIKVDGKSITELEMLRKIGLDTEANRIISSHLKEIDFYQNHVNKMNEKKKKYYEDMKIYKMTKPTITYNSEYKEKKEIVNKLLIITVVSFTAIIITDFPQLAIISLGTVIKAFDLLGKNERFNKKITRPKKPINPNTSLVSKPILKQQLEFNQCVALAEAYNRKLYSDISNK